MCSCLGYALTLCFSLGLYIVLLSIPTIADTFSHGLPKTDLWKEYFLYCMPTFIGVFLNMTFASYCNIVASNGLRKVINGRTLIMKACFTLVFSLSIITTVFVLSIKAGLDVTICEAIYYALMISCLFYLWFKNFTFLKKIAKDFLHDGNKRNLTSKIKVKSKGLSCYFPLFCVLMSFLRWYYLVFIY